jgi:hypothetical protein
MRLARRTPLLLVVLAALLAGCGGNQIAADEVPVDPPVLTIPTDEDAAPGAATADADADENATDEETTDEDADADADAAATAEPGTGGAAPTAEPGTGGGTTGGGTTGGAQAQPTAAPTQAPPADTGGAQADEGLDQFCADNPGAC